MPLCTRFLGPWVYIAIRLLIQYDLNPQFFVALRYSISISRFNVKHAEKLKAFILECVVFSFLNLIAILYINLFASIIRCLKVLFFAHSEA